MVNNFICPIEIDSDGECILTFPDEFVESTGWQIGDTLVWKQLDNGSWSIEKREDSDS